MLHLLMSEFSSVLSILLLTIGTLNVAPQPAGAATWLRQDTVIVSRATVMAEHHGASAVLAWLRREQPVRAASIGLDGRTLIMVFRDGVHAAVLAAGHRGMTLQRPATRHPFRSRLDAGSAGRATVLEPFASELSLGPHAGDIETQYLQAAGYRVDRATDTAVTVDTLASLSQYEVVYLNTHSGVNQYGEGVIAAGQLADDDPAMAALVKAGTVFIVGVEGTSQRYYGVLSSFITEHEGQFQPGSILFINGCSLLRATLVWNAFAAKGAGALISFSDDVAPRGASLASILIFDALVHGQSVSHAVQSTQRSSTGITNGAGGPAHIGYVGNGSLLLQPWASSPTATPISVDAPTQTPVPTPTVSPTSAATLAPRPAMPDKGVQARPRSTATLGSPRCGRGRLETPALCSTGG